MEKNKLSGVDWQFLNNSLKRNVEQGVKNVINTHDKKLINLTENITLNQQWCDKKHLILHVNKWGIQYTETWLVIRFTTFAN